MKNLLLVFLYLLSACSPKATPAQAQLPTDKGEQVLSEKEIPEQDIVPIQLNKNFFLKKGEKAVLSKADLTITINEIRNNLCPPATKCPRAGEIEVDILWQRGSTSETHTLSYPVHNYRTQFSAIKIRGLTIQLKGPTAWMKTKEEHGKDKTRIDNQSSMTFHLRGFY